MLGRYGSLARTRSPRRFAQAQMSSDVPRLNCESWQLPPNTSARVVQLDVRSLPYPNTSLILPGTEGLKADCAFQKKTQSRSSRHLGNRLHAPNRNYLLGGPAYRRDRVDALPGPP